ncbi:MAG: hypothetical protein ACPGZP_05555 [Panacagrimonas sp.]
MTMRLDRRLDRTRPADATRARTAVLHQRSFGRGAALDSRRRWLLWLVALLTVTSVLLLASGPVRAAQEGEHQHGAHHDHNDAGDASLVPTPEGMMIEIVEPGDEAVFAAGATVPVKVRTQGMNAAGDHWHLYVDGELQAMVGAGRTAYELELPETLDTGEHELKVTISNATHQEYDLISVRAIQVKASDDAPPASATE